MRLQAPKLSTKPKPKTPRDGKWRTKFVRLRLVRFVNGRRALLCMGSYEWRWSQIAGGVVWREAGSSDEVDRPAFGRVL